MVGDAQALLERCLLLPSDETARKVFADWLDENRETELGTAIRGERGAEYLRETRNYADSLARPACLRLLWATVLVVKADADRRHAEMTAAIALNPGVLTTLPDGWNVQSEWPTRRPGLFRRLFGG